MRKDFICPDLKAVPILSCLENCRLRERCMPIHILHSLKDRPIIKDEFSITELYDELRPTYLKRCFPYKVAPWRMTRALLGTAFHQSLVTPADVLTEELLKHPSGLKGRPDAYTQDGILIDTKTTSKYKVLRLPKVIDPQSCPIEFRHWLWQGSGYYFLLKYYNFSVRDIQYWVFAIDHYADDPPESMKKNVRIIPYSLKDTKEFFMERIKLLQKAQKEHIVPPVCSNRYNNNERCFLYCEVNELCSFYEALISLPTEAELKAEPEETKDPIIVQLAESVKTGRKYKKQVEGDLEVDEDKLKGFMIEKKLHKLFTPAFEITLNAQEQEIIDWSKLGKEQKDKLPKRKIIKRTLYIKERSKDA